MPRHFGNRRMASGSKPRYAWVPALVSDSGVSGGTTSSPDLLAAYLSDSGRDTGPGMVIERVIGTFVLTSQTIGVASAFTIGLLVVPEGGLASNPNVDTEINSYLWWHGDQVPKEAHETAAGVFVTGQLRLNFDVRSRRRLSSMGDELRMIVDSAATPGFNFSMFTRTLLRVT